MFREMFVESSKGIVDDVFNLFVKFEGKVGTDFFDVLDDKVNAINSTTSHIDNGSIAKSVEELQALFAVAKRSKGSRYKFLGDEAEKKQFDVALDKASKIVKKATDKLIKTEIDYNIANN